MPNYELPQVQNPDILGAYLRGRALPGQMQLQQQQIESGQQEQQMRMLQMAMSQSRLNAANQFDADQAAQPSGPMLASNGGPPMSPGSPTQGQDPLAALASPQRLAGFAQMGVHNAILNGTDPIKPIQDAMTARAAAFKDQQERAKFELAPAVAEIENVRTSENPERLVMANPAYMQTWQKYAPQLGLHPNDPKDMTPENVRAAATLAHNDVAAQSHGGIEPLPMPEQLQKVTNRGYSYLVDKSGKPTEIPGQITPYQGAQLGMEQQRLKMAEKVSEGFNGQAGELLAALTEHGVSLPAGMRSKEQQLATVQGLIQRHPDMSPDDIAEAIKTGKIDMAMATRGATQFATGKQGDTVRSLSVATSHLDLLDKLVGGLQNKDTRLINQIGNKWQQETGGAAPTNFDTAKNIVADEVTKAVIGYGGSTADREKAAAVIDRANSPEQLRGAIATYKQLMAGQLQGLQLQYEHATKRQDFQSMLTPEAQQQIGSGGSAPTKTIGGKTYYQQNGKWYVR